MKGLGVFSPSAATSRYVLVASGQFDYSGNGTPRADGTPLSLNLLDFRVTERAEKAPDPFSPSFEPASTFSQFPNDTPFSFPGNNFDDYMTTQSTSGIGEFSVLHSAQVDLPGGHLTAMKWLKIGPGHGEEPTLLVVGSSTGDVHFYDADLFVGNNKVASTFSESFSKVPVKCLATSAKNMLGVAGLDGQVSAMDLSDASNYNVIDVSYGKWKVGMVTCLSWSYRLWNILASSGAAMAPTDTSGVVVWDLKAKKPSFSFRDPGGRVNPVAIDWVPGASTQLVVAYGDDNAPGLQLWDLRQPGRPQSEVKAHTRGVTDLKFCPHDPNLLLTSSKDDTTKCWHLTPDNQFELLSTVQTEALSHHARVEWHPNVAGLFLSQANDGELCVHHMMAGKLEGNYMPMWTRKRAGVASGFAGQVTTWNATDVKNYTLSSEYDSKTEKMLDNTLKVLSVLHDEALFTEFCESKAAASSNEFDKLTWAVLKCQYKGQLRDLLDVLGYPDTSPPTLAEPPAAPSTATPAAPAPTPADPLGFGATLANPRTANFLAARNRSLTNELHDDDAEDFFNSLTLNTNLVDLSSNLSSNRESSVYTNMEPTSTDRESHTELAPSPGPPKLDWCADETLRSTLVKANYLDAAKRCLELNKVVECLLLAYVGGDEAFLELAAQVVAAKNDPFLNLLHMLVKQDVDGVLETSNARDWKETLCVLYTYTSDLAVFKDLAASFGRRLLSEGLHQEASVCFILASEYHEVVRLWKLLTPAGTDRSQHGLDAGAPLGTGRLQDKLDMLLKLSVLSFSTSAPDSRYSGYGATNEHFDAVLMELSEVFVDAGKLDKALETLNVKGASNSEQMAQLKSKIHNQLVQTAQPVPAASPAPVAQAQPAHHLASHAPKHAPTHHQPLAHHGSAVHRAPHAAHRATTSFAPTSPVQRQTATPLAPSLGLNTAPPAPARTQSMVGTATRTVPLSVLQNAASRRPASPPTQASLAQPPSQATSSMGSYSTALPPTSSLSSSGLSSVPSHGSATSLTHQTSATYPGHAAQTARPSLSPAQPGLSPQVQPLTSRHPVSSSAPGAVAGALNPGMPIPWPNPTPTQLKSSTTVATQETNNRIISTAQDTPKGELMPKADLDLVVRTLNSLVADLGTARVDLENKKSVNDLVNTLNRGGLPPEANSLLSTLCKALSAGDANNAKAVMNTIINSLWNNENKVWIMCLKRLVLKMPASH